MYLSVAKSLICLCIRADYSGHLFYKTKDTVFNYSSSIVHPSSDMHLGSMFLMVEDFYTAAPKFFNPQTIELFTQEFNS